MKGREKGREKEREKGREKKRRKWREKRREKQTKRRKEGRWEWRLEDCSPLRQSHWSTCQMTGPQRTIYWPQNCQSHRKSHLKYRNDQKHLLVSQTQVKEVTGPPQSLR